MRHPEGGYVLQVPRGVKRMTDFYGRESLVFFFEDDDEPVAVMLNNPSGHEAWWDGEDWLTAALDEGTDGEWGDCADDLSDSIVNHPPDTNDDGTPICLATREAVSKEVPEKNDPDKVRAALEPHGYRMEDDWGKNYIAPDGSFGSAKMSESDAWIDALSHFLNDKSLTQARVWCRAHGLEDPRKAMTRQPVEQEGS